MTKFEWERQLKKGISGLPHSEQQRVLDYYGELFSDKIDAGMSESEIIAEFGNPYDVANRILVDFYNDGKNNAQADEYIYSTPDSIEETNPSVASQPTETSAAVKSGATEKNNSNSEKNKRVKNKNNTHKERGAFGGMITLICTLTFFVLGAVFGLWHPGWMVFLLIPVIISLIEAIEKNNWHIFCYPVLVVIIYLLCGFYGKLWHPMWVLFITIPLYYSIGTYISKNSDEKITDKKAVADTKESSDKGANADSQNKPSASKHVSGGRIVAAVLLTIVLVYVMIVVWAAVIGLFCAGIGMIIGGVAVLFAAIATFATDVVLGILILGLSFAILGLGLVFTFGMAGVFKYCAKMCRQFGKSISASFGGKE